MKHRSMLPIPKCNKSYKYHESAVINLTTILAVLLSSLCQVVVIIFHVNEQQEGVLLVITLCDCLWMFPMIYLLFIPKVCMCCGYIFKVCAVVTYSRYSCMCE